LTQVAIVIDFLLITIVQLNTIVISEKKNNNRQVPYRHTIEKKKKTTNDEDLSHEPSLKVKNK